MKKTFMTLRFVFLSASLLSLMACGGGSNDPAGGTEKLLTPIGNLNGSWQVVGMSSSATQGCSNAINITATIFQNGNQISAKGSDGSSLSGTISASNISMSGSYPEDGGTTTESSFEATVASDCNQFTGNGIWSWSDGIDSCAGTTTVTGTRISASGCGVLNTSGLVQLTTNNANDIHPDWSPDGTKIVFSSDRTGNREIWIVDADGTNLTRLTNTPQNEGHPHFSFDNSKIVFWSERSGDREIFTMNVDGSAQKNITNHIADDGGAAWSSDGLRIVFRSTRANGKNKDIWTMDSDGANLTQLTSNTSNDGSAQFSPDGSEIVFTSNRSGTPNIWIMNTDGSNPSKLTNNSATTQQPHFSADGSKIIFHSYSTGNSEIMIMNRDGGGLRQATTNAGNDVNADFNPDASKFVFQSNRSGNQDIWVSAN